MELIQKTDFRRGIVAVTKTDHVVLWPLELVCKMYVQKFEFGGYKIPRTLWADLNGPLWWEFRRQCWEKNRLVLKALEGRNAVSWIGLRTVKKHVHLKGGSLDWEFFWRVPCLKATTWRSVSSGSASKKYSGWRSNCGSSGWGSILSWQRSFAALPMYFSFAGMNGVELWGLCSLLLEARQDVAPWESLEEGLEAVEVKPALHWRLQVVGDIRT